MKRGRRCAPRVGIQSGFPVRTPYTGVNHPLSSQSGPDYLGSEPQPVGFLPPGLPKAGQCPTLSSALSGFHFLPGIISRKHPSVYERDRLKPLLCCITASLKATFSFSVNMAWCQTQLETSKQTIFRGIKCPNDSWINLISHSNLIFSSILLPCSSLIYMPISCHVQ